MSKKILVIKPPHRMFPLGMAYVLACLENHGIDFDFADAEFGNDYKKLLRKNDYFAVATGGLLFQNKFFLEVSRSVREIGPAIPVILGGAVTKDLQPSFLFDKLHYTYGIIGEAETSFPFLVDALRQGKTDVSTIPGLVYKDPETGEIRKNPVRRLDLSTTDILPAWHRFDVDYYINNFGHGIFGNRRCMPVISARGCIGTCTFCSNVLGTFRKRPIDQVIREIGILNERYDFDWVGFYNEMFYSTKEELTAFCEAFTAAAPGKKWSCDLRVDAEVDTDTFRMMKNSGCVAIFGGLESGSDKILTLMQKRTTREMIIRFYRSAEVAGLPCFGGFLVGNEGETAAEIRETVDMVNTEKMRALDAVICTYPGTKIYKNAKKRGLIGDEWEYLQHLDFFAEIWDYTWPKKEYVNISDISDDRFLETVSGELRRFHTYNLTHYVPKNMAISVKYGLLTTVTGKCSECGCTVTLTTMRRMLGIQTFCGECFHRVEFNLYELPEFNGHYRYLCAELHKSKRLAIVGTNTEALHMLKYDYFKLDYASLVAFVEIDRKPSGMPGFYHLPRVRLENLRNVNPDTLLIADDLFGDAEFRIRNFYLEKNLQPPRILHLLPDTNRHFAPLLRFVRQHAAATFLNKCIVVPAIRIPLLIAGMKVWLLRMVKAHYEALSGNAVVRGVLKVMRR